MFPHRCSPRNRKYKNKRTKTKNRYAKHVSTQILWTKTEYGALYVKDGINFEKIQDGGHQEKNKRGGTENVAEIVGLRNSNRTSLQKHR